MGLLKSQIPILLNRFHCPQNKIRKVFTRALSGTPAIKDCTPTTNDFLYWMLILHMSNLYFTKQPGTHVAGSHSTGDKNDLPKVTLPSGVQSPSLCHCALVRNHIQGSHFSVWPLSCKVSLMCWWEIHDSLNLLGKFKWQHMRRLSTRLHRSWWLQCLLEQLQDFL